MRSLFEENDREQPKADADLTLGIGSLLSIFFGVLLICGIFFGFGYSMGRRNARPVAVASAPAHANPAQPGDDLGDGQPQEDLGVGPLPPLPPDSNPLIKTPSPGGNPDASSPDAGNPGAAKPATGKSHNDAAPSAASSAASRAAQGTSTPGAAKTPTSTTVADSDASGGTALTAVPFSHRAPLPSKPHAGIMATPPQPPQPEATPTPGHPVMVQIAAVSRQEDAETLAGALRKRGFNPQVHSGTTDKFFHVQVGPFTDKTEAETIKQHLLSDGYNAILK